jgi:hypothetical protein
LLVSRLMRIHAHRSGAHAAVRLLHAAIPTVVVCV